LGVLESVVKQWQLDLSQVVERCEDHGISSGRAMPSSSSNSAVVGGRIRSLRQQQGVSQETLAAPDLSASYLSRIESGSRRVTDRVLVNLAARLGTTAEHLRTGVDPAAASSIELSLRYAELALRSGEPTEAVRRFKAAVSEADGIDRASFKIQAQLGLGQAWEAAGELESALVLFHKVADLAVPGSKSWLDASLGLVRGYRQSGDFSKSIELGENALETLRRASDWPSPDGVRLLSTLQASYQVRGDLHYAKRLAAEAVGLADQLDDRRALASALWNISLLNAELGAVADAVATAERALALLSEIDAERDLVRLRIALARLYTLDDQPGEALRMLDRTETRVQDLGITSESAYWRLERARALLQLGSLDEAEQNAVAALDLLGDAPRAYAADALLTLGNIAWAQDRSDVAANYLRRGAQALTAGGSGRTAAQSWAVLGDALDAVGDVGGARDAYRAAATNLGLITALAPIGQSRPSAPTGAGTPSEQCDGDGGNGG